MRTICIFLPQMSGDINDFINDGKNVSFKTRDDTILGKYNEIWNKSKKFRNINFIVSLFMMKNTSKLK